MLIGYWSAQLMKRALHLHVCGNRPCSTHGRQGEHIYVFMYPAKI